MSQVACQNFKMSRVGVLSRLHNAVGNLATYIWLRQSFVAISFERCRYFLAHVACRNLPWQGLYNNYMSENLLYSKWNRNVSKLLRETKVVLSKIAVFALLKGNQWNQLLIQVIGNFKKTRFEKSRHFHTVVPMFESVIIQIEDC